MIKEWKKKSQCLKKKETSVLEGLTIWESQTLDCDKPVKHFEHDEGTKTRADLTQQKIDWR